MSQANATVINTADGIAFFQLSRCKAALGLEVKTGMSFSRRSIYAHCKRAYGLKGSKQKVYDQMCALVEKALADKEAETK